MSFTTSMPPPGKAIADAAAPATAEHAKLEALWDGIVQNATASRPVYNKTVVLLLTWKESDLDTIPEVIQLVPIIAHDCLIFT